MKYKRMIPNILTVSRIITTFVLSILMCLNQNTSLYLTLIVMLTGYIYVSDFIDGKIARHFRSSSPFGAKLDIIADLFYIISQDVILIARSQMSGWLLVLILIEFLVFTASSALFSDMNSVKKECFDKIGSITANYYYIMPLLYVLLSTIPDVAVKSVTRSFFNSLLCLLTAAALSSRAHFCLKHKKKQLQACNQK